MSRAHDGGQARRRLGWLGWFVATLVLGCNMLTGADAFTIDGSSGDAGTGGWGGQLAAGATGGESQPVGLGTGSAVAAGGETGGGGDGPGSSGGGLDGGGGVQSESGGTGGEGDGGASGSGGEGPSSGGTVGSGGDGTGGAMSASGGGSTGGAGTGGAGSGGTSTGGAGTGGAGSGGTTSGGANSGGAGAGGGGLGGAGTGGEAGCECTGGKVCDDDRCVCPDDQIACDGMCRDGLCCPREVLGDCPRCGILVCHPSGNSAECEQQGACEAGNTCGLLDIGLWDDGETECNECPLLEEAYCTDTCEPSCRPLL